MLTKPYPHDPRYLVTEDGDVYGPRGRKLKPMMTGRKRCLRPKIRISTVPRIDVDVGVMVLETYVGPRPAGMVHMHADDDQMNNKLANLSWGTHRQNALTSRDRGQRKNLILNAVLAADIFKRREDGECGAALAREYAVSPQHVCSIFKRRTWL